MKKKLLSMLLAALMLLSLASCGPNGDDPEDSATTDSPVTTDEPVIMEDDDKVKVQIYAAPEACGTGDGSSPENAIGGLTAAVAESRKIDGDVTINLLPGTYALEKTLALDERDSGTTFFGDGAVITSGSALTEWQDAGDGVVYAEISALARPTQFLVNGENRDRTRYPENDFLFPKNKPVNGDGWANDVTGDTGDALAAKMMAFTRGDIPEDLYRIEDVEFVILQYWMEARLVPASINFKRGEVVFTSGSWRPLSWSYGYYLENVREGLNVPGRWYHDREENRIYYHLQEGETIEMLNASYPVLRKLIDVAPAKGKTVNGLRFVGITFTGTDSHAAGNGYHSVQAETNAPSAIRVTYAVDCSFTQCNFENLGGYALWLGVGCKNGVVERCKFRHLGGGAVRLGELESPTREFDYCDNHSVRNNLITDCSEFYLGSAGILVGHSSYNTIEHNDISGQLQWAISVGWIWSYFPLKHCQGNRIAYNYVHDLGTGTLGTHGAIYLLGVSPATEVEYNLVENVYASKYWGAGEGFILDNSCSGVTIQNNIVRNANAGGWGCNFNCFGNIIRNNIFAFGVKYQLTRYGDNPDTDNPPPSGEIFTQNIIIYETGDLFKEDKWFSYSTLWDYNLYWCTKRKVDFMHLTLEKWQNRGLDTHSIVADPLFADAKNGDFTLANNSPAYKIGFVPFSLETVGILPLES